MTHEAANPHASPEHPARGVGAGLRDERRARRRAGALWIVAGVTALVAAGLVADVRGAAALVVVMGLSAAAGGWLSSRGKHTAGVIRRIEEVTATRLGPDFFHALADQLALACGADYALIVEIDEVDRGAANAIALSHRGTRCPLFTYRLGGTPCEKSIGGEFCHFPRGVATQFPADALLAEMGIESYMGVSLTSPEGGSIGLIALLHSAELPHPADTSALLRVVAARSGAELNRLRADRKLSESRRRLEAMVDNSPGVGIQMYDAGGRVLQWNRASETMFGYSAAEAAGKTLDQLIQTAEQASAFRAALERIARTGEPVGPEEFAFRRRDGRTGTCVSTIFKIPGERGADWFVCMDLDVTELRRLDEQLRQSQRLGTIGQLAGGIAHDFNNLLTIINGYSDLLADGRHDPTWVWNAAAAIRAAGERAAMLTRQLLAFSKRQVVEPQVVDLGASLRRSEPMLRRLLGSEVELITHLCPEPAPVLIDPGQLEQVVLNLAINARDAMSAGGLLTLETSVGNLGAEEAAHFPGAQAGPHVRLTVRDTGRGIPDELRSRIFEPFFTTKAAGGGTGLGLATVHAILAQTGGAVRFDSHPGAGTAFHLVWPVASGAPEVPRTEVGQVEAGTETVLLAEDEPIVREFVKTALQARGYQVLAAAGGDEALRMARQSRERIAVLVTDLAMPGMRGSELAALLPGALGREVPVIFVTGYADESPEVKAAAAAGRLLQKPFTPAALLRKVRETLDAAARLTPC